MPRVYLVRHGEPAATWGGDNPDPGLTALGRAQALHAAQDLKSAAPALALTSPLQRCRETAAAFEMESGARAEIVDAVRELPSPDVADRGAWLRAVMEGRWRDYPDLAPYRARLLETLAGLRKDAVVFTHFVAINIAAGAAEGRDDVLVFRPAHASITVLDVSASGLRLWSKGAETPAIDAI
ncbi:MAG: histidine phosphatase family protein [Alphaproteobacteria bacterium]|nr:histidine phosphatase family protein [Alphaproteobacteria bacterium]